MSDNHARPKGTTSVSRVIQASRHAIYQAFLDADAVAAWLAPEDMRGELHTFEPREGGEIRMSLIYQNVEESPGGKSSVDTDTFRGRVIELIPDEKVVWLTEFESPDPAFAGKMKLTWSLADVEGGTQVTVLCENIPSGIRPEGNEAGSRSTLEKLAAFLE
jgi:uncharacterized protein YndB with AHSA1/START domain